MRVIVPVRILLACEIGAVLGFLGYLQFWPLKYELDTGIPFWRQTLVFISALLLVLGSIGGIVAIIWCAIAALRGRHKHRAVSSRSVG